MNTQSGKTDRVSFREALRQTPKRLLDACLHNWGWKLLSLFLAICLWVGLINQDPTLTRKRNFNEVPIAINGESTLLNNGLIVLSGLENASLYANLEVQIPQRNYSISQSSNFNPRVDLSKINSTGEQTLRVLTTSSTTYGTVQSVSPESISVVVDEYVTNYRIPVTINVNGSYPNGYYGATPVLTPSTVAISGPKTIVDTVSYVSVDFDPSTLPAQEGAQSIALPIRLMDKHSEEISAEQLTISSASTVLRSITVEQQLYPMKKMVISDLVEIEGMPAEGYEIKNITVTPSDLIAAGDAISLENTSILFSASPINVEGRSESFSEDLSIRKPATIQYLSNNTVKVQVEIGPVIDSKTFENIKLTARNYEEKSKISLEQKSVSVIITGPVNTLKEISASKLKAYVDLSNITQGEISLPVLIDLSSYDLEGISYSTDPEKVLVTIVAPNQ